MSSFPNPMGDESGARKDAPTRLFARNNFWRIVNVAASIVTLLGFFGVRWLMRDDKPTPQPTEAMHADPPQPAQAPLASQLRPVPETPSPQGAKQEDARSPGISNNSSNSAGAVSDVKKPRLKERNSEAESQEIIVPPHLPPAPNSPSPTPVRPGSQSLANEEPPKKSNTELRTPSERAPVIPELPLAPPTPIPRRSGGVLQGSAVFKAEPRYPALAKAARASGPVVVEVTIDDKGRVVSARAISGHPLLRDEAVRTAKLWKFRPTLLSGNPVLVIGTITFNFNL